MNVPVDDWTLFRRLLAEADALLLDFDGPVCSVFAGYPAPDIAAELRALIRDAGHPPPPQTYATDPHTILGYVASLSIELGHQAEKILCNREIEAVEKATPTPGAAEFMATWHETGRPLAIVSNNTADAIADYLSAHSLDGFVDHIQGRDPCDPALMKPNPHLIQQAAVKLMVHPGSCLLVGDSVTDVQAAKSSGVPVVGFSARPEKIKALSFVDPNLLIREFPFGVSK